MTEHDGSAPDAGNAPLPPEPERERATRPYMATVFGVEFAIAGATRDSVTTHLVKRLRREIDIRLATFEDGEYCARHGVRLEQCGEFDTPDLFGDGGGA